MNKEKPHAQEINNEGNEDNTSANQQEQDIFLIIDEMDSYGQYQSGDWTDLKRNEVHLMMSLKPIGSLSYDKTEPIELNFPDDIDHLQFTRVYRCTQTILEFYKTIVKRLHTEPSTARFNSYSTAYNPGHEIFGDLPEILFLPQCETGKYGNRDNPVMHNFKIFTNKIRTIALLWRLQKKLAPIKITVIIDFFGKQECKMWLAKELEAIGISEAFYLKVIGECRGMEFPSIVTISGDSINGTANQIIDTWTRVTTCLSIIHVADHQGHAFRRLLGDAVNDNVAKIAEEQEMKFSDFQKRYANDPQETDWFIKQAEEQESYLTHQIINQNLQQEKLSEIYNEYLNISSYLTQVRDLAKHPV